MFDLVDLLLFGVPDNKWELLDGKVRLVFPFIERHEAEAHFDAWSNRLCALRGVATRPPIRRSTTVDSSPKWRVEIGGCKMTLFARPIEMFLPISWNVFEALLGSFWRRELWPDPAPGFERGWSPSLRHSDVRMNLWRCFEEFVASHGGKHSGRVAIALSDRSAVEPDQYYYPASATDCLIEDEYFQGTPQLVAEVHTPATRAINRGPRMEVYRRAGVGHLWHLDPELEIVETYQFDGGRYLQTGRHTAGSTFRPPLIPGVSVSVDTLFDTQEKRREWGVGK